MILGNSFPHIVHIAHVNLFTPELFPATSVPFKRAPPVAAQPVFRNEDWLVGNRDSIVRRLGAGSLSIAMIVRNKLVFANVDPKINAHSV
jgi:hypothetical protein